MWDACGVGFPEAAREALQDTQLRHNLRHATTAIRAKRNAVVSERISAIETDLAELIVQLSDDSQSHILVPAIHKNREEIRELFERTIADGGELGTDPEALTEVARRHLRAKFLSTPVAVSGANFGVAETGAVCVVESEGNGRFCTTLPEVLVTVMG